MTPIYIAYFPADAVCYGRPEKGIPKSLLYTVIDHTIKFTEHKLLDQNQYNYLIQKPGENPQWVHGPWVPFSPYSYSKEDAVQQLRWLFLDWTKNPTAYGGPEEMKKYQVAHARRIAACERHLRAANAHIYDPPWRCDSNNRKRLWI